MQVRIKGYTFNLLAPYAPGHELTPGEAQALNDLRAENIQNNFRHKVNAAVSHMSPGQLLPQPVIDGLKADLADYDAKYTFAEKAGRSRVGDLEQEALAVAAERVQGQLEASGTTQFTILSPESQKLIAETALLPAVVEEARARVSARRSALAGGMDSL